MSAGAMAETTQGVSVILGARVGKGTRQTALTEGFLTQQFFH